MDYSKFLRERLAGVKAEDSTAIVGDPIGREALISALAHEAEELPGVDFVTAHESVVDQRPDDHEQQGGEDDAFFCLESQLKNHVGAKPSFTASI